MLAKRAAGDELLDLRRATDDAVFGGVRAELHFFSLGTFSVCWFTTGSGWRDFDQRQHRD